MKSLLAISFGVVGLMVSACGASPDGTDGDVSDLSASELGEGRLLALGDSMAFGWDPLRQPDPSKVEPADYEGYAELLGKRFGYPVDNASCPGEASGSLVDAKAKDNGCDQNRAAYGLHVDYDEYAPPGGHVETQLEFIKAYLTDRRAALITLDIGGNDLLLLKDDCQLPSPFDSACMLGRLPFYQHGYSESLRTLFASINEIGCTGALVVLTQYVPDYNDAVANLGVSQYNGTLRETAKKARDELGLRIIVADGYAAFADKSAAFGGKPCDADLLIHMPDGTCDIHPSPLGHEVLADAIQAALDADAASD